MYIEFYYGKLETHLLKDFISTCVIKEMTSRVSAKLGAEVCDNDIQKFKNENCTCTECKYYKLYYYSFTALVIIIMID